ncbi:MAG TPA: hypothetical protein VM822_10555 [Pseudolabrys sp.]|jgi:hypothetical protein|nr:hypothetical protein [Pseudolabrys sp.]
MPKLALEGGCKATNVTSPYEGTALIAAAHLGHDEVVRISLPPSRLLITPTISDEPR